MTAGTIYAIADGAGAIKIGRTTNLTKRLRALQSAHPRPLSVVYQFDAAHAFFTERLIHRHLQPKRLAGEWFAISELEARDAICSLGAVAPIEAPDMPRRVESTGGSLRAAARAAGLTLTELAKRADCSHNHLSQCASLKKAMSGSLALRIRKLLPDFSIEEQQQAFEDEQARLRASVQLQERA